MSIPLAGNTSNTLLFDVKLCQLNIYLTWEIIETDVYSLRFELYPWDATSPVRNLYFCDIDQKP